MSDSYFGIADFRIKWFQFYREETREIIELVNNVVIKEFVACHVDVKVESATAITLWFYIVQSVVMNEVNAHLQVGTGPRKVDKVDV